MNFERYAEQDVKAKLPLFCKCSYNRSLALWNKCCPWSYETWRIVTLWTAMWASGNPDPRMTFRNVIWLEGHKCYKMVSLYYMICILQINVTSSYYVVKKPFHSKFSHQSNFILSIRPLVPIYHCSKRYSEKNNYASPQQRIPFQLEVIGLFL